MSLLRSWRAFASEDEEAAAGELAELLDGFTLAVEQVAVHLATRPEVAVRACLEHLRSRGLTGTDGLVGQDAGAQIAHQTKQLSVILETTLAGLEQAVPGAVAVLQLAAAMPSEAIAWPWLEGLVGEHHPELLEPTEVDLSGAWPRIRRALLGRGLITDGGHPGRTGRMHRLVAAHLRPDAAVLGLVDRFAVARAAELSDLGGSAPELWEVGTLLHALGRPLSTRPELLEEFPNFLTVVAPAICRTPGPSSWRVGCCAGCRGRGVGSRPGAVRSGGLLEPTDPTQALHHLQEALNIRRASPNP